MAYGAGANAVDPEMQRFLEVEGQKARFQANVHTFTDLCWDKCVERISAKMDSKAEQCIENCVNRFIDTTNFVVQRLENMRK